MADFYRNRPAKHITPRNLAIYKSRQAGETYASIAARHGITIARARQIFETWQRRLDCAWRAHFIPAELLAHNWTAEDQWQELQRERGDG
jgi:hypothetical protein